MPTQRKPLGPDSTAGTQGDLLPMPYPGPLSATRTHDPQCRRALLPLCSQVSGHAERTPLWTSSGPRGRPSLEEGEGNGEGAPQAQSSVSAAVRRSWGCAPLVFPSWPSGRSQKPK